MSCRLHPPTLTIMIDVENLTKDFGSRRVVDALSFQVRPGVVTGFLGPNGAGKTTTMRMILGLDRPTAGTALIGGRRYRDLPRPLTTVGALLNAGWVHEKRSARAHLRWLAASNDLPRCRVDEVLETVGLSEVAEHAVGGFSLGMTQRLGLAAALLGDPTYLLFDEPVNGLDPEGIQWVRRTLRRLAAQGRTVMVSSHLLSEMAETADHLVIIAAGRLVADTSVSDFLAGSGVGAVRVRARELDPLHRALQRAGGTVERVGDAASNPALRVHGLTVEQVGEEAAVIGAVVHEISQEHASLEEAFMRRTDDALQYRGTLEETV